MGYTPPYFAESRVEDVRELLEFHIDGIEYLWMDRGRMLNTGEKSRVRPYLYRSAGYPAGLYSLFEKWLSGGRGNN